MAILLGVDTGGTYTDAVLLEDDARVLATAKALTTRHDLAVGIGRAIRAVLDQSGIDPGEIALASLSTTLATNALIEEQGGRIALVAFGFDAADLKRQGLEQSLRGDPLILVRGGHGHSGERLAELDLAALGDAIDALAPGISGFAVAGQFATRNPEHELAARDMIIARTARPVSCSHDLSARLNGPKRAMTAVLNARLIGMIDHLISAAEGLLLSLGISAPLMVVRGDGALISSAMARLKPIETILSGPAASLIGARWLTGESDAMVADIGGTTTDIAILRDGRPKIDPEGARVGSFRTMVEAVAMRTHGLGGDSEVHLAGSGPGPALHLGPKRVLPVSLCAMDWPDLVHSTLDKQCASERAGEYDGRFVVPLQGRDRPSDGLSERELRLLEKLGDSAAPMGRIVAGRMDLKTLEKLTSRGLVMLAGPTPSDAAHVLGQQADWDALAARKALHLAARQRRANGELQAKGAEEMAARIVGQLVAQTTEALLISAFAEDGEDWDGQAPESLARHVLTRKALAGHRGLMALNARLDLPVVGLGASAPNYYVAVGERLGARMILPEHAGVANALGAVVGQVSIRVAGSITCPSEGCFRVHFPDGPRDFGAEAAALSALEADLSERAMDQARAAGAGEVRLRIERDLRRSTIEGREVFVEAEIRAIASGRPRIALG